MWTVTILVVVTSWVCQNRVHLEMLPDVFFEHFRWRRLVWILTTHENAVQPRLECQLGL